MKLAAAILVGASLVGMALVARAADTDKPTGQPASDKPDWAYAVPLPSPPAAPQPPDLTPLSLPGSKFHFTRNKVQGQSDDGTRTRVQPADWFPEEHPPMPPIVAMGDSSRGIAACSICHMPEGRGRSENASLAGLPAQYFVDQMNDMRNDLRKSAEPGKANAILMQHFAKAMTPEEIQAAATYYAAIPWVKWETVIESRTAPKAKSVSGMWVPLTGADAGLEPLGDRIIEVPSDPESTELKRDPHAGFIAYVPVGALAAGKALVTTGGDGKTMACAGCHGAGLTGMGNIPNIAGRSPSYVTRQLYDFRQGARNGANGGAMKAVVAKLSTHDILTIAAYVASLPPGPAK